MILHSFLYVYQRVVSYSSSTRNPHSKREHTRSMAPHLSIAFLKSLEASEFVDSDNMSLLVLGSVPSITDDGGKQHGQ